MLWKQKPWPFSCSTHSEWTKLTRSCLLTAIFIEAVLHDRMRKMVKSVMADDAKCKINR